MSWVLEAVHFSLKYNITAECLGTIMYMYIRYLAEESGNKSLPNVDVVVPTGELGTGATQGETVHDPRQLLPHAVRQFHRTITDKVVVTPLRVLVVWRGRGRDHGRCKQVKGSHDGERRERGEVLQKQG